MINSFLRKAMRCAGLEHLLVQNLLPKGSAQESERQIFLISEVAGRLLTEMRGHAPGFAGGQRKSRLSSSLLAFAKCIRPDDDFSVVLQQDLLPADL